MNTQRDALIQLNQRILGQMTKIEVENDAARTPQAVMSRILSGENRPIVALTKNPSWVFLHDLKMVVWAAYNGTLGEQRANALNILNQRFEQLDAAHKATCAVYFSSAQQWL